MFIEYEHVYIGTYIGGRSVIFVLFKPHIKLFILDTRTKLNESSEFITFERIEVYESTKQSISLKQHNRLLVSLRGMRRLRPGPAVTLT